MARVARSPKCPSPGEGELYTSRQALAVFRADFPRFGFLEGPVRVWVPRFQALWSQDVGDGPVVGSHGPLVPVVDQSVSRPLPGVGAGPHFRFDVVASGAQGGHPGGVDVVVAGNP